MSNAPTLINLPPPPSDPVTPSDVPSRSGTPNSTTTSMSELSTVAIKDGHRGHLPHHSSHATSHTASGLSHQLDAERADRISRLAGLERVTTARNPPQTPTNLTPGATAPLFGANTAGYGGAGAFPPGSAASNLGPGGMATSYFDAQGNPTLGRERSTVGSASATGSVGARTTWAGDSEIDTADAESMDLDATSSVGGESEAGRAASLVGFGEGARTPARQSVIGSPGGVLGGKAGAGGGVSRDPRAMEGLAFEAGEPVGDVTNRGAASAASPSMSEQAERIVRENMDTTSADRMRRGQGPGDLGKFGFEK